MYHLFGSKRGLLAEVGRRYGVGMARAAFGPTPQDLGPDDATAVVQRIFDYVDASPGSLGAFLLANDPDEGGPAQDANRAAMLEAIGGRLEEWTAAGRIAVRDTTVAAELLFGLVESGLRDCYLRRGGSGREPYVEELGRLILGYLRG